jgi:hypothetical protein
MGTTTTTFALNKPTVGGDDNAWGGDWNSNADKLDDLLDGTTGITPNLISGWEVGGVAVTSTAAELNVLDGVTASTAELNILDGVTASTAELNILDGVTASTAELNILDGVTSTAAELNILDGVTATTAELNFVDGVTSNIQTQLDAKADLDSPALTGTPTAPTATAGTNTTQLATTAFVNAEIANDIGTATAGLAAGAVGSYAFLVLALDTDTDYAAGNTFAGSNLRYAGASATTSGSSAIVPSSGTPSGTWRNMGYLQNASSSGGPGSQRQGSTVFLRIS